MSSSQKPASSYTNHWGREGGGLEPDPSGYDALVTRNNPLRLTRNRLTACCDEVDPYSILKSHGCLLRRPQKEDRRSRRKASNEKERGRPSVWGEPLLSQALREEVSPRKLAFARQSTRPKPEDRRVCQETAGSRPQGAALRKAPPEVRVPQSTGGIEGEQIYSLPRSQTDRVHQKKRAVGASERNEWLRAAWKVTVAGVLDPRRLVFVDECGTHVSLAPVYGYSARGERVRLKVPRNRGKNTTLLASMSTEGMGSCLAVEGSTTAEVFEAYLEYFLAPELKEGQVVVMDNLAAHKPHRVRELIEDRGCELMYLPSYSPDYNPIEEAFSKIKGVLRDAQARTRRTLVEAMGQALSTVTTQDATGFFEHCGYPHLVGQPL